MALNQNTTAISLHPNHLKGLIYAVDGLYGDTECKKISKLFATIGVGSNPTAWFRINFGDWKHVQFVEIHNRITLDVSLMKRLSNTKVYVYGETPTDNRRLCGEIVDGVNKVHYMVCKNQPLLGKGIELFQHDIGINRALNLCEVVVLGY